MFIDDFFRTDLCRLREWHFIVKPWCLYHPLRIIFHMSAGTFNHIADTVYQAYFYLGFIL